MFVVISVLLLREPHSEADARPSPELPEKTIERGVDWFGNSVQQKEGQALAA